MEHIYVWFFELMSQDVFGFLDGYGNVPSLRLHVVKKISQQLMEGLEFIHSCGVVHNGCQLGSTLTIDFHVKNILVEFKSAPRTITVNGILALDKSGPSQDDDGLQEPFTDSGVDQVQENVSFYQSEPLCRFSDGESFSLDDIVIKISDFGKGSGSAECLN
jgi:serine/threonine protein kinase